MQNPETNKPHESKSTVDADKVKAEALADYFHIDSVLFELQSSFWKERGKRTGSDVLSKKATDFLRQNLLPKIQERRNQANDLLTSEAGDKEQKVESQHSSLKRFYRRISTKRLIEMARKLDEEPNAKHGDHLRKLMGQPENKDEVLKGYSVWAIRRELENQISPLSRYDWYWGVLKRKSGTDRIKYIEGTIEKWTESFEEFKRKDDRTIRQEIRSFLHRHELVDPGQENIDFVLEEINKSAKRRMEMVELQLKFEKTQ